MADLRDTVAAIGFDRVQTYIQSGNLIFDGPSGAVHQALAGQIGDQIEVVHGLRVPVVLRTGAEIAAIAARMNRLDSELAGKYHHVLVMAQRPTEDRFATIDRARYAPDTWRWCGDEVEVIYPNGSGRSKLTIDVFERALGITMTARNRNTINKIAALC